MKTTAKSFLSIGISVFILSILAFPVLAENGIEQHFRFGSGKIVVANRADGSISIISTSTDEVISTIDLPDGENLPEPMYVVYTAAGHRVFVGDRANNRVVVYDASNFSLEDMIPAGNGIFHMWADPQNQQLWVNNDIDNTATVISPWSLKVITTVFMPEDLVDLGGKPHDVVLDFRHAYVTIVGLPSDDYVVKFSRETFMETDRQMAGKDSHLSLTLRNRKLFVPSQNSDTVFVFDRRTLSILDEIPVPGAHGAGMTWNGKFFYTTNLPGGGPEGLFTISTRTNQLIGSAVDTPFPTPHNIALTPNGKKLYVTHSGATANQVTVYTTTKRNPIPVFLDTVIVGLNPFGLAYVP